MRTTASNSTAFPSSLAAFTCTVFGVLPSLSASMPVMSKVSEPSSFSEAADSPSGNCSGMTPMPIRLERGMRSNDSVMTARTPRTLVHVDAQSREGLGDDRTYAQKAVALGRPLAIRARAVFLAAQHDQRGFGRRVVLRGVV